MVVWPSRRRATRAFEAPGRQSAAFLSRGQKATARPTIAIAGQRQQQGGLFEPGHGWNRHRHGEAEKADPERHQMEAGEEGADAEQQQEHEARRLDRQDELKTLEEQKVHRHQDGDPVRRLRPDQPEPRLTIRGVRPCGDDADKPDCNRQELPIAVDRVAGEIAIGHAKYGKRQRSDIRQVMENGDPRKELF